MRHILTILTSLLFLSNLSFASADEITQGSDHPNDPPKLTANQPAEDDAARQERLKQPIELDDNTVGLLGRLIGTMAVNNKHTLGDVRKDELPSYSSTHQRVRNSRWDFAETLSKLGLNNGSDPDILSEGARKSLLKIYSIPANFTKACEASLPALKKSIADSPTEDAKRNAYNNVKIIIEEEMGHIEHVLTGNAHYDSFYDMSKAFPDKFGEHELSSNSDFLSYAFYKRRFDEGGKPLLDAYTSCGKKALTTIAEVAPEAVISPIAGQWGPYHNTDYGIEYGRDGGASGE